MAQIADMVRRLGAAGCSVEQIAAEVEAREREVEEVLAKRREQNRKAQQNHRARKHDEQARQHDRWPVSMTDDKTVSGAAGPARGFLKKVREDTSVVLSKEDNTTSVRVSKKNNKIPFPKELLDKIPEEALEIALRLNFGPSKARSEWSRFGSYCLAHAKTYADLMAAWRNWLTSSYQKTPSLLDEPDQSWRKAII